MAFKTPAPSMGDILAPADILGHLLVIAPTEYQTGIVTKYTKAGDDPSDAVQVDVAVLTQQREDGSYGVVYRNVLWFNVGLRLSLRKSIHDLINDGDVVLARMGQGQAKSGQDAPYQLVDAVSDADALAFAEQWLANNPEFISVAQMVAKQAANVGPATPPPAGQTVPGVAMDAGPKATAPTIAPVPTAASAPAVAAVPKPSAPVPTANTATPPAAAADMLAALNPEERKALLAALQNQG